ncbi:NBS-LRR type resistance protein [Cucumis melo var. makuwa]|uniref:NBS-LRR type resistance protein n=1 Tax=Cucumis melo var. makuwa TaxID=1194695 RepID=A0A5A7VKD4_CUCMM|nr:NBS-LRR type resistance protein [Cucumis melo var. makuwa]TYK14900.1 NBS-LRR type resistance protein [Cucumis melo var. makuwa]
MLNTGKEFRGDNHDHFKQCNQRSTGLLEQSSPTTTVVDLSRLYNDNTSSLNNEVNQSIQWCCLEKHTLRLNQMLELQSQPTLEGSQPPTRNEICEAVSGRRPGYSKGLGWSPRPKSLKAAGSSLSSSYEQEMHVREVTKLKAHLDNAQELTKEQ